MSTHRPFRVWLLLPALFISFFLLGVLYWTHRNFGEVSVDKIIYSLQFGMQSAMAAESRLVNRFIKYCLIVPSIVSLIFLGIHYYWRIISFRFVLILLVSAFSLACFSYNVPHYIVYQFSSQYHDYFATHYIRPDKVKIGKHPKNLVLIYVESFESTYQEKALFGKNLLNPLSAYQKQGVSFEKHEQMPGTGWTIAGIVSTQCGVPLKLLTVLDGNKQGNFLKYFLPNAICLSDVLHANGYKNVFLNGPRLEFAGVKRFLSAHHFDEQYGKTEWEALGYKPRAFSGWGLYDDDLFAEAKKKLHQLMRKKQLFSLTVLTIDTHGPDGLLSNACRKRGTQFTDIVHCTASQVADFIQYIDQMGWRDQISIVVLGDHLAMQNPVSHQLKQSHHRSIYNLILSPIHIKKSREQVNHFDFFPTILYSLGFKIDDGRLGLGFAPIAMSTIASPPENNHQLLKSNIDYSSRYYESFWLKPHPRRSVEARAH